MEVAVGNLNSRSIPHVCLVCLRAVMKNVGETNRSADRSLNPRPLMRNRRAIHSTEIHFNGYIKTEIFSRKERS